MSEATVRSRKEDDVLQRSMKKVKESHQDHAAMNHYFPTRMWREGPIETSSLERAQERLKKHSTLGMLWKWKLKPTMRLMKTSQAKLQFDSMGTGMGKSELPRKKHL